MPRPNPVLYGLLDVQFLTSTATRVYILTLRPIHNARPRFQHPTSKETKLRSCVSSRNFPPPATEFYHDDIRKYYHPKIGNFRVLENMTRRNAVKHRSNWIKSALTKPWSTIHNLHALTKPFFFNYNWTDSIPLNFGNFLIVAVVTVG